MRNRRFSERAPGGTSRPTSPPDGNQRLARLRAKGPPPAWGDQSLEERIPSFLESLYFESQVRIIKSRQSAFEGWP